MTTLLSQLVQDGVRAGTLHPLELPPPRTGTNAAVSPLGQSLLAGVTEPLMLRGLLAWVEVFGMISFELFGHLHNVVSNYDGFFDYVVVSMAALVGLPLPEYARE